MTVQRHATSIRLNPIAMLEREWQRLARCPRTVQTVNTWRICPEQFSSLDELLTAAGYQGKKCDPIADQVLARLVRHAATDQLAARIVLQRVLPPIIAIARRRGKTCGGGFDDAMGSVLSHVWEVIRTYPIDRRPAKIAANIVRDTEYFAFVRDTRRRPLHIPIDDMSDSTAMEFATDSRGNTMRNGTERADMTSSVLFRELLREAHASKLSASSMRVLEELSDQTLSDFAERRGITERMARNLRRDAINELRVRMRYGV